jgi:uncharacterized transporter YbjL
MALFPKNIWTIYIIVIGKNIRDTERELRYGTIRQERMRVNSETAAGMRIRKVHGLPFRIRKP